MIKRILRLLVIGLMLLAAGWYFSEPTLRELERNGYKEVKVIRL